MRRDSLRVSSLLNPLTRNYIIRNLKPKKTERRIEASLLQLLLPVTRLLVRGGSGIDELIRAAKGAYLRAATEAVAREGGRVSISHLSVATGMTRKEVSALLSDADPNGAVTTRSGQQRALRVLRGWLTDPRFHNHSGRPDELRYRANKKSFALLVKLYGGDVTPKSVLRELERMEIVSVTGTGALRLRRSRSRSSIEVHYELSELARLFDDFALAAVPPNSKSEVPSFFAFRDSTVPSTTDAAYFMARFSRRAAAFLEDFQQWSAAHEPRRAPSVQDHEAIRVGLGVYLLRSDRLRSHPVNPGGAVARRRAQAIERRQR
jgi:hypothetical protein